MNNRTLFLVPALCAALAAQETGPAVNVLFAAGNNLVPAGQEILVAPDGGYAAVLGAGGNGDVVVTAIDADGAVTATFDVAFPAGNEVSPVNGTLVISRRGSFLCAYGADTAAGDLVFLARDAAGAWTATNVAFPAGADAPPVGTRPAVSRDEAFIACRGGASADLVIVPVDWSTGTPRPGTPFVRALPGGNDIPGFAIDPVIAPDGRSLAVPGTLAAGDLAVITLGRPVAAANTTATNVDFPGGNAIRDVRVPVAASPRSDAYAVHGQPAAGDVVLVPVAAGVPGPAVNVLWPADANTADDLQPPAWSGDGRLIAVNGTLSAGDVVLLPVAPGGAPGTPVNVAFPGGNFVGGAGLPPVVANDARLVLARGSPTIGDLVALRVAFVDAATIAVAGQNVLYPAGNNVPDPGAGIALAPDRSWCATTGSPTLGDVVITSFDADGAAGAVSNVLHPGGNNLPDTGVTPVISDDGLHVVTRGSATVGDAVLTAVEIDPANGLVRPRGTVNVLYPAGNNNAPAARVPRFDPSGSLIVSAGSANVGDLVVVPLRHRAPRFLRPADRGTTVPVRFVAPFEPGAVFVAAASAGRWPGIPLADGRRIPLNPDPLFLLSRTPGNPFFLGFDGLLDGGGFAGGSIVLPALPGAAGLWFHVGFVIADPGSPTGVGAISEAATCVIR